MESMRDVNRVMEREIKKGSRRGGQAYLCHDD